MKEYTINVEGFSDYQKALVQKAFFKLGIEWHSNADKISNLSSSIYSNVFSGETPSYDLCWGSKISEFPTHTYKQLLTEAGMEDKLKYKVDLDEEVDLKFTWRDLAKMYAVLGHSNGSSNVWRKVADFIQKGRFDTEDETYDRVIRDIPKEDVPNYYIYQDKWLEALFGNDIPEETETQNKVRELREQAELMLERAKELEDATD